MSVNYYLSMPYWLRVLATIVFSVGLVSGCLSIYFIVRDAVRRKGKP